MYRAESFWRSLSGTVYVDATGVLCGETGPGQMRP